ncbi:MAG: hypothetical protein AAFR31_05785 [Cyanobacteria bacterium J06627_8]
MTFFTYILLGIFVIVAIVFLLGSISGDDIPENISENEIRRLALQGEKIKAIKYYRALHNVSLRDAKAAIEEMIKDM